MRAASMAASWRSRAGLAICLCWLATGPASAQSQISPTGNCLGSYQLAGGQMGCRSFDETAISIPLAQCGFSDIPTFTAYGRHEGQGENVYLKLMVVDKVAATVRVTTTNRDSHQICSRASIEWEAHRPELPTGAAP